MAKKYLDASGLNQYNASVDEKYKNSLNTSAMFMLANFSGLPTKLNNAEWKYVLEDASTHVLLGKKHDNSWTFGDDTDTLMDAILDQYAEDDTLFSNIYRLSVILSLVRLSGDLSEITNPEWKYVILDSDGKILLGIRTDYTWYLGASINEIFDCAITTYIDGGSTRGTFSNKPTKPNVGQVYFCTDKQTTEGGINGIPIYCKDASNGVWVDAMGRTVS